MAQKTLILHRNQECWLATHVGEGSAKVVELFGTATLPLPFTASADYETVRQTIQKANPQAIVTNFPDWIAETA